MDILGIEIRKDAWVLTHLKSSLFNSKIVRHLILNSPEDDGRIEELKRYHSANGLRQTPIAIVLPRSLTLTRVFEIPAPSEGAVGSVLKFEIERHLPFPVSEADYGFRILGRKEKGGPFSVLVAMVKKVEVSTMTSRFALVGMKPSYIGPWLTAVIDALSYLKIIHPKGRSVLIGLNDDEMHYDLLSGNIPVYSRSLRADHADVKEKIHQLNREMRLSLALSPPASGEKAADAGMILSAGNIGQDFLSALQSDLSIPCHEVLTKEIPSFAIASFGGALCIVGKTNDSINLAVSSVSDKSNPQGSLTGVLAVIAILLLLLTAVSTLIRDRMFLWKLDSAIVEIKAKKAETEKDFNKLKSIDERIKILEEIGNTGRPGPLELIKSLTEQLPRNAWLTGFEYGNGVVLIDGVSERASSIFLILEKGRLMKDIEFAGAVTKGTDGKEHFRIKFKVRDLNEISPGSKK
ncbi:MAG: PilN domain-containing protein [Nitrospiria bacterium]